MVRIAVRTLTLNIFKLREESVIKFLLRKTPHYFKDVCMEITGHAVDMDTFARSALNEQSNRSRLVSIIDTHLDHIHYINDLLLALQGEGYSSSEECNDQNGERSSNDSSDGSIEGQTRLARLLCEVFYMNVYAPVYLASLASIRRRHPGRSVVLVSKVSALFELSHLVKVLQDPFTIQLFLTTLFFGDRTDIHSQLTRGLFRDNLAGTTTETATISFCGKGEANDAQNRNSFCDSSGGLTISVPTTIDSEEEQFFVDEFCDRVQICETTTGFSSNIGNADFSYARSNDSSSRRLFFKCHLESLAFNDGHNDSPRLMSTYDDHECLYSLFLLKCICLNKCVSSVLLEAAQIPAVDKCSKCDPKLAERLIQIIEGCANTEATTIRPVTLYLCCSLLRIFLKAMPNDCLFHSAIEETVKRVEQRIIGVLRRPLHTERFFLEMFEDEFYQLERNLKQTRFESILEDPGLYLPPANTPLSGLPLSYRLPNGSEERTRRAIQFYFILHRFSNDLLDKSDGTETLPLPIIPSRPVIEVNDRINLKNSDLLVCTVITGDAANTPTITDLYPPSSATSNSSTLVSSISNSVQRYLVTDQFQLILVEPDSKTLGWAIVRFVGLLQDTQIRDSIDTRALQVTVEDAKCRVRPNSRPLLRAKFVFGDHIRCMVAKERLTRGRESSRAAMVNHIYELFGVAPLFASSPGNQSNNDVSLYQKQQDKRKNGMSSVGSGSHSCTSSVTQQNLPGEPNSSINQINNSNSGDKSSNNKNLYTYGETGNAVDSTSGGGIYSSDTAQADAIQSSSIQQRQRQHFPNSISPSFNFFPSLISTAPTPVLLPVSPQPEQQPRRRWWQSQGRREPGFVQKLDDNNNKCPENNGGIGDTAAGEAEWVPNVFSGAVTTTEGAQVPDDPVPAAVMATVPTSKMIITRPSSTGATGTSDSTTDAVVGLGLPKSPAMMAVEENRKVEGSGVTSPFGIMGTEDTSQLNQKLSATTTTEQMPEAGENSGKGTNNNKNDKSSTKKSPIFLFLTKPTVHDV